MVELDLWVFVILNIFLFAFALIVIFTGKLPILCLIGGSLGLILTGVIAADGSLDVAYGHGVVSDVLTTTTVTASVQDTGAIWLPIIITVVNFIVLIRKLSSR